MYLFNSLNSCSQLKEAGARSLRRPCHCLVLEHIPVSPQLYASANQHLLSFLLLIVCTMGALEFYILPLVNI